MRPSETICALILVGSLGSVAAGQQTEVAGPVRGTQAFERVAAITAHLQFSSSAPEQARLYAELDTWTAALVAELDKYVEEVFTPDDGSDAIQNRVRAVLGLHVPYPEYGDLPLAHLMDLPAGPVLVLAYTIVRGAHHDLATIRGYRWNGVGFQLVASAAEDFEGYGMFKSVLPSPAPTEVWLLAWGQAHTFNGKKVRIRVYAFDGEDFRIEWDPEDVFNADVRPTEKGFVVDHELLTPPQYQEIHDEYVLDLAGPIKSN